MLVLNASAQELLEWVIKTKNINHFFAIWNKINLTEIKLQSTKSTKHNKIITTLT